jgi:hypothetical protein
LYIVFPAVFSSCESESKVDPAFLPMLGVGADSITMTSAVLRGSNNHSGSGKLSSSERGFYWNVADQSPTNKDNIIELGSGSSTHCSTSLSDSTVANLDITRGLSDGLSVRCLKD